MADIPISVFIDKLISTTNCKSIEWNKLSSSGINLRPLPDDKFAPVTHSYAEEIDPKSSYVASINGGYVFLIFLVAPFGLSSNGLSLRVQSNTSEFAKEYLNTSKCNDANLVALLKRLYNIVDLPLNEIDDIVDDFIF